jgi:hypothetical protein
MASSAKASKTTKTNASKTESQQDDKPVKVTLYITPKLAKQFATHAVHTDQSKSELFAEMIQTHCRRFVVHDHSREAGKGRADGEVKAVISEEDAA